MSSNLEIQKELAHNLSTRHGQGIAFFNFT